jgi:leucyl aminopeptidase (aminopeptidase T)
MKITKTYTQLDSLRSLSPEERGLVQEILKTNLGWQSGEKILVVTDLALHDNAAAIWFEAAKELAGAEVEMIVLEGQTHSGEEPPTELVAACERAQIVILHTMFSLTHTQAGKQAARSGNRVASLPGVDYEMMLRTLPTDYQRLRQLGEHLQFTLQQGRQLRITSPAGTNLTAEIRQSAVFDDNGTIIAGNVGNLPAGEVFFAPLEGSTNGTWVVNGSMADEDELDEPITITIKDGYAVEIEGGSAAQHLREKLTAVGPDAFAVGEIGIGTNPAVNPRGPLIEAEKAFATAHLALGNSSAIGGSINVPIHLDGVTLEPVIAVDEKTILSDNTFTLK